MFSLVCELVCVFIGYTYTQLRLCQWLSRSCAKESDTNNTKNSVLNHLVSSSRTHWSAIFCKWIGALKHMELVLLMLIAMMFRLRIFLEHLNLSGNVFNKLIPLKYGTVFYNLNMWSFLGPKQKYIIWHRIVNGFKNDKNPLLKNSSVSSRHEV